MQTFIDPSLLQRLRVGPLALYFDAYLEQIEREGFLPSSVPMQMYAIASFSKWLENRRLDLHEIDEVSVEQFLKRDADVRRGAEPAPLRRFLAMLRDFGVTAAKLPEPGDLQQGCIDKYRRYLMHERGLAETSVPSYVGFAEQFLSDRFSQAELRLSDRALKRMKDFPDASVLKTSFVFLLERLLIQLKP
jgi:hypothetical protein